MSAERQRLAAMLRGHGIEIGALHRPMEVPAKATVTYVDRLPLDQLREHYTTLEGEELARVDVLSSAEDLSAFADRSLDFVIANHLIEHLENPIRALKEFERVLRRRGLLYLCVPDSRVTFDRTRPLTRLDHLLAEYRGGPEAVGANRRSHYLDWVTNVDDVGVLDEIARPVPPERRHDQVRALMEMDYSIHFHCWNGDTFLDFMAALRREEGISLEVLAAVDTVPLGQDELIVLAGRAPSRSQRKLARRLAENRPAPTLRDRLDVLQRWFKRGYGYGLRGLKATLKASPAGPALVRAYRRARRRQVPL